ncbi:MAG: ATPase, T2SS/T4P/T4SS family, partial [Myxococcota bacterium]
PRPAPAPSVRPAPPQAAPPQAAPPQAAPRAPAPSPSPLRPPAPAATSEGGLAAIMGRLGARFALTDTSAAGLDDTARWAQAKQLIDQIMGELVAEGSLDAPQDALAAQALREAVGLGALESVLARAGVRELVVEGPETVLVDEGQGLAETDLSVSSSAMLTILARRLAARGGATDLERPVLKGFLPEGGQVTVVQAPLAVGGPFIEVRRQAQGPRLEGLVDQGMLDIEMADLLEAAVESRRNVVVLGPSGSAVTTLLGALASRAKAEERMVVVAPTPDVAVRRDHVLRLSVGDGPFASVLREALQLRADRLVVDGVGAGDGHGALLALATRGEGVLMGVHAAADDDATASLRLQAKLGGLADDAARALVARSVDLVVQVSVTAAGPRVMRITEIGGDNGELRALDLYRWTGTAFERLTR